MAQLVRASAVIAVATAIALLTGCAAGAADATDKTTSAKSTEDAATAKDSDVELDFYGNPSTLPDEWMFAVYKSGSPEGAMMLSYNPSKGTVGPVPYTNGVTLELGTLTADHRHTVTLDESELYLQVQNLVTGSNAAIELDAVTGILDFEANAVFGHKTDPNVVIIEGEGDSRWFVDVRDPEASLEMAAPAPSGTDISGVRTSEIAIMEMGLPDAPAHDEQMGYIADDGTVWEFGLTFNVNGSDTVFRASSFAPGATEWNVGERVTVGGIPSTIDLSDYENYWIVPPFVR